MQQAWCMPPFDARDKALATASSAYNRMNNKGTAGETGTVTPLAGPPGLRRAAARATPGSSRPPSINTATGRRTPKRVADETESLTLPEGDDSTAPNLEARIRGLEARMELLETRNEALEELIFSSGADKRNAYDVGAPPRSGVVRSHLLDLPMTRPVRAISLHPICPLIQKIPQAMRWRTIDGPERLRARGHPTRKRHLGQGRAGRTRGGGTTRMPGSE